MSRNRLKDLTIKEEGFEEGGGGGAGVGEREKG